MKSLTMPITIPILAVGAALAFVSAPAFAQDHAPDHPKEAPHAEPHPAAKHVAHPVHKTVRHVVVHKHVTEHVNEHTNTIVHRDGPGPVVRAGGRWHSGQRFDGPRVAFTDYDRYHVRRPPPGYEWVQDDGELVLISLDTGLISDIFAIPVP